MALNVVMTKHDRELVLKLYRVVEDGTNQHEAENARVALLALLKSYGLKWGDLPALVSEALAAERVVDEEKRRRQSAKAAPKTKRNGKKMDALTAVHLLLQRYIDMQPHEYIGVALWALHTHIYDRFVHTPRLSLMSPTRQCGKSNTIKVLSMLAHDPQAASNMTAAALFRLCDEHGTVIIDEADNFELFTDPQKRAVINSGFDKTASTVRRVQATYDVHTPMVFGGIGRLPLPLMDRSLCIHLERSLKDYPVLNPDDEVMRRPFDEAFTLIKDWAEDEDVKLNPNPEMPFGVRARTADKWKVLIAIADSFGPEWGERAREAAVAFRSSYSDEEVQTMLLLDCETVFKQRHVERIRSEELLSAILDLDTHYPWMAYRGPKDDENTLPRKLKQGDMARLLGMFRIRSKKIRFNPAPNGSFMGYERQDFQKFWDTYGTKSGTPELKAIAGGKK